MILPQEKALAMFGVALYINALPLACARKDSSIVTFQNVSFCRKSRPSSC